MAADKAVSYQLFNNEPLDGPQVVCCPEFDESSSLTQEPRAVSISAAIMGVDIGRDPAGTPADVGAPKSIVREQPDWLKPGAMPRMFNGETYNANTPEFSAIRTLAKSCEEADLAILKFVERVIEPLQEDIKCIATASYHNNLQLLDGIKFLEAQMHEVSKKFDEVCSSSIKQASRITALEEELKTQIALRENLSAAHQNLVYDHQEQRRKVEGEMMPILQCIKPISRSNMLELSNNEKRVNGAHSRIGQVEAKVDGYDATIHQLTVEMNQLKNGLRSGVGT